MLRTYLVSSLGQAATGTNEDLQVVRNGTIKQIQMSSACRFAADGMVSIFLTTDPIADAAAVAAAGAESVRILALNLHAADITTTGQTSSEVSTVIPQNLKVGPGDRLYIGMVVHAGAVASANMQALVFIDE